MKATVKPKEEKNRCGGDLTVPLKAHVRLSAFTALLSELCQVFTLLIIQQLDQ